MPRQVLALVVCVAAASAGACGSSTHSVTSPSTDVKCVVTAVATPSSFSAAGGSGTLTVSANRECQWSVAAASGWIQLGGSTTGQGDASISFMVAANADPATRTGTISVGDQQIGITQQAASCVFTVDPRSDSVSAGGGRKTITVTASSRQCAWTARSNVEWLAVRDGAQGTGTGPVTYEARGTTGPTRSGTLLVAGQVVTVTQGDGCTTSITPTSQSVASSGGTGSIAVATDAGCSWSAQSNVSWIAITSGQTGNGRGTVGFSVNASEGPARSGTLTIDEHVFTIAQASGCRYTIDPASQSIAAAGGSGTVSVHAAAGCEWSASSNAPWVSVSSGTTGSGDGRVQFTAAASTGPARSGTLTVAGQTFTLTQASGCSYALVPPSQNVGDSGGTGSFAVNASAGCAWTATSRAPWIAITGAPSGAGGGTVSFSVSSNPMGGPARSGPITVNDQTFTVNQTAGVPCAYTLTPVSQDFSASAGSGSFTVNTVLTCPWTAYSNDSWITITGPPSGAGIGTVNFNVAENPAGTPRLGTISVRGQTFTISQAALRAMHW
jgi:hypothetical protein